MEEVIKWIDAESEKPDDGIDVLVCRTSLDGEQVLWIGSWDSADDCWRSDSGGRMYGVIHWAEMPEGPKEA